MIIKRGGDEGGGDRGKRKVREMKTRIIRGGKTIRRSLRQIIRMRSRKK